MFALTRSAPYVTARNLSASRSFASVPVHIYNCTSSGGQHKALHFSDSKIVLLKKHNLSSHDQFSFTSMEQLKENYTIELTKKMEAPLYIVKNLNSLATARKRSDDEQERILYYLTKVCENIDEITQEIWEKIESD